MAHAQESALMRRQHGQVMAFMALVISLVLVPIAAYAVDAAAISAAAARLQAATVEAALHAAEQLSAGDLRAHGKLDLDRAAAMKAARAVLAAEEPSATLRSVTVSGLQVTVLSAEFVRPPMAFLPIEGVNLRASASARLTAGYDSPSSRLPLPTSSF